LEKNKRKITGRSASKNVRFGKIALSVGNPHLPTPSDWEWVSLLDVADMASGHTPSRRHSEYWDGNISWMNARDARLFDGKVITETSQTITEQGLKNSATELLPKNTVCLSRTGASIGYVVILGKPIATNQGFVNFICGEKLLPKYLLYLFLFERSSIISYGEGSAYKTVYFPEAKAFHILLPSIDEQKKIVATIDMLFLELDDLKNILNSINFKLEQYKKSFLRSAFNGTLTSRWRSQFSKKFDIDQKSSLPYDWSMIPLFDIAEINPKKSELGTIDDHLEVSFVPMKCVEALSGKIDLSNTKKYSEVRRGYTYFKNDDIIFAKITPCMENGKISIVRDLKNDIGFGSTEFHVIRLKNNEMSQKFYFHYLIQDEFRDIAKRHMKGTAGQLRVSSDYLKNVLVPKIPFDEQKQISSEIEQTFLFIKNIKNVINSLFPKIDLLHNSILKQAFEGKLVH
jgi:type I restriction enzyme, S subunit